MFIVLEMDNGGVDVENFVFNSATQALSAFIQVYNFIICMVLNINKTIL